MLSIRASFASLSLLTLAVASPQLARAACDTTGSDTAYGDYWIERSGGSCDCVFKARQYSCVAVGGFRSESAPVTLTTVSGACDTACEDLSGYGAALTTVAGYYVPGSGYNCDTVFTDYDGDKFGACIDHDDYRNRIGVKTNGVGERVCDGFDSDGDGTVDDGFTQCPLDQKRVHLPNNLQGVGANKVNVVELMGLRRETDATIAGPYGALSFTRTYNSRRETNDAISATAGRTRSPCTCA